MGAESQTEYPPPKKKKKERTQRTEKRQTEQEILRADWEKRRRRRRSEQGGGVEKGASLSLQPGFSEVTVLTHRGWTGKITLRSSFFTP